MITYDLNARGRKPLYEYLCDCIRRDIISGKLTAHEKLPSKRTFAKHLNVGVITIANAYEQLLTEGFLYAEEKKGYFVEDISNYVSKPDSNLVPLSYNPTEPDEELLADFKVNRTSLAHFPASIWSKYMREALSLRDGSLYKTVPYKGLYDLRYAIANYLRRTRGMDVTSGQIIIGAGTEYLYSRLMQMFGRATTFAIENPGYKKFAAISSNHGNPWKYVPIDEHGLDIEALEDSGADVVHISPANHFPTGIVMPVTRRVELFEWVNRAKKRYIIEDDYDSEFRYSGKFIMPLFAQDVNNKVIYINTFSKSMVPSLRISYMVLPDQLLKRYEETMSFYSCTVSSFEQYALARFIENGHLERHINHLKTYYRTQRLEIISAILRSPLSSVSEIKERNAGTHFLLRIDTRLSEKQIRARAEAEKLRLSFFSDYGYTEQARGCTLVINYAAIEPARISNVISRLCCLFPETAG